MTSLMLVLLMLLLLAVAAATVYSASLLAMAMLFGIYSLLCASLFVVMDAPDVAFTEAAVGAGIATMLMLAVIAITGVRVDKTSKRLHWPALLTVCITGGLMIWGLKDLTPLGSALAPAHQGAASHYITHGLKETGVPNLVTAVLASYRGFDTLGEVFVIFAAGLGVLLLLDSPERSRVHPDLPSNMLLGVVARFLVPLILLFACYVQFHGDFGPGGGFQAGVIFSAGGVIYTLTFGLDAMQRALPPTALQWLSALGVGLYLGTGCLSLLLGANFLDYSVLASDPLAGQHLGILLVELGVGICVASVLLSVYYQFAHWSRIS